MTKEEEEVLLFNLKNDLVEKLFDATSDIIDEFADKGLPLEEIPGCAERSANWAVDMVKARYDLTQSTFAIIAGVADLGLPPEKIAQTLSEMANEVEHNLVALEVPPLPSLRGPWWKEGRGE